MSSKQELFHVLLVIFRFSVSISGVEGVSFSDEELAFFASLGLCAHFGGTCDYECPYRIITHKWAVPLCREDTLVPLQCCLGPAPTGIMEDYDVTTTISTTKTTATTPSSRDGAKGRCGQLEVSQARQKRIVGGQVASSGTWPWLVAFRSMLGSHACSGAVIAQRWVITAAHCFKYISNPSLWRVRIGEYNLLLQEEGERDVYISDIILHPGYKARMNNKNASQTLRAKYVHDIALVRLAEDANTEPLCLPLPEDGGVRDNTEGANSSDDPQSSEYQSNDLNNDVESSSEIGSRNIAGEMYRYNVVPHIAFGDTGMRSQFEEPESTLQNGPCWVAGWGVTLDASLDNQVLHEVSGQVVNSEVCGEMWGEDLDDDMLCFGDGTYGPCEGDSGSPLSCEQDGRFYLKGVVSWGTEDCNVSGYPSVFTNLNHYLNWINEQTSRDK